MDDAFARPILTVDIVPLTLHGGQLCLLRGLREGEPFAGQPALIGGYVRLDEDADLAATARRVLADKAGLTDLYVEQLAAFSGPARDPRGWSASVVHVSLCPAERLAPALARGLELVTVERAGGMPFDHDAILAAALGRLRGKGAYSDLPARFLPDGFTLAELHAAYEAALGQSLNIDAFRRKVIEREFLEETGEKRRTPGANKPSLLYRLRQGSAVFDRRL